MRYAQFYLTFLIIVLLGLPLVYSQFWFQSGATSSFSGINNNGSQVYIQTTTQNYPKYGSFAFWIGETLKNNAFVQIGYEIPNQSGVYKNDCTPSGCSSFVNLSAGKATWFWEYFPAGYDGNNFYGNIGPDGSAGGNGIFNLYTFKSQGNIWYMFFNNKLIGSVNLNSSTSGDYTPAAFAEYADALNNTNNMNLVKFKNFSFFNQTIVKTVGQGLVYIGYGKNSQTNMHNPYGVAEVANTVDYFEVGSGLPQITNGSVLWNVGYFLNVFSNYANISESSDFLAYTSTRINAPNNVYINNAQREVFDGWVGKGVGSYSGLNRSSIVNMDGNISEYAQWRTQYYLNVTTPYGSANGSGWYDNGSVTYISIPSNIIYINNTQREVFDGWNIGNKNITLKLNVNKNYNISPIWTTQYYLNVTTPYGSANGSGWYDNGSVTNISINTPYIYVNNNSRIAFIGWTNNTFNTSNLFLKINKPLHISAIYKKEYQVYINATNPYGSRIVPTYYKTSFGTLNSSPFVIANTNVNITNVYYKNTNIPLNKSIYVNTSRRLYLNIPVYNVTIGVSDYLFLPLNATLNLTFKNGSTIRTNTGDSGKLTLNNVPMGYVNGSVTYNGKTIYFVTKNGGITIYFLSGKSAVVYTGILIIILFVIADIIIKKRKSKQHPWHSALYK